jgi:hypothetical protein
VLQQISSIARCAGKVWQLRENTQGSVCRRIQVPSRAFHWTMRLHEFVATGIGKGSKWGDKKPQNIHIHPQTTASTPEKIEKEIENAKRASRSPSG